MKKMLLISGLTLTLSACGYTVKQLTHDRDLRHQVLKECAASGATQAKKMKKCRVAAKAQLRASGNMVKEAVQ